MPRPPTAVPVTLPKPTPAVLESLAAALDRLPSDTSTARVDSVLLVAPGDGQLVVDALTEHMRAILKADRMANAYREVQLRAVRAAVIAAHEGLSVPRAARAPQPGEPADAEERKEARKRAEAEAARANGVAKVSRLAAAQAEAKALRAWQDSDGEGPCPETPNLDAIAAEKAAAPAARQPQVNPRFKMPKAPSRRRAGAR